MSANNQLIIKKRKESNKWDIFMNYCVDNEIEEKDLKKEGAMKTETSLIKAIRWCHNYMSKEIVEYGYTVLEDKTMEDKDIAELFADGKMKIKNTWIMAYDSKTGKKGWISIDSILDDIIKQFKEDKNGKKIKE